MRGVEKQNSCAVTSAMLGSFRDNARTRMEFLELIRARGWAAFIEPGGPGLHRRLREYACMYRAVLLIAALAGQALFRADEASARAPPAAGATADRSSDGELPRVLGQGAKTARMFCDVLIERDPAAGITIPFPPHTGEVTLSFTLHNRHTYSEDEIKNKRAYHRYTARLA